ncbi:glycoside hydrolase family 76 protein [Listeria ilorinensis]|uniref:glycoside hydrolase family 76 protein n=1 Tax=Listeria ilorinensis TaxID=2867439 RepID=UPI001EF672C9|nr:glycoside hydrolase family 76 protein [Listeria ilorinensis]
MNWNEYADLAQKSLTYFFAADDQQFLNNFYPTDSPEDNQVFNYWWLAHTVDVRLDAFLRTENGAYLELAEATYTYNKNRNGGTLRHDFYDDMLWNALCAFRLYKVTEKDAYLEDAVFVWQDLVDTGWNDIMGGGFAWKRPQMDYKNTPVNVPFIILSTWLYQELGDKQYLDWALKTYDWQRKVLVRADGFVEDGINRMGDSKIDTNWTFTYNQGVYIGANLGLYRITKEAIYLERAIQTADISLELLVSDGVFKDEGEGGDEGLFKGIFYRYLEDLYQLTGEQRYLNFMEESCEILVANAEKEGHLLMGMDWHKPAASKVPFSAELSGMMALEMVAKSKK